MKNGVLDLCWRIPIVVGNLQKDNMYELYKGLNHKDVGCKL